MQQVAAGEAKLLALLLLPVLERQVAGGQGLRNGALPNRQRLRPGVAALLAVGGTLGLESAREAGQFARGAPDGRGLGRVADGGLVGVVAGEEAGEAAGLVHVDPCTVDIDTRLRVVEELEFSGPVAGESSSVTQASREEVC